MPIASSSLPLDPQALRARSLVRSLIRSPIGGLARGLVRTALVAALLTATGACSLLQRPVPPGPPPAELEPGEWTEQGVASWYGEPFHGRQTASGETYDMEAPTAAHQTLPFGTLVRVRNLDNGRVTELTINDRGPFVDNRIIDVSRWGARQLDMIGPGTAMVRLRIVEAAEEHACWRAQMGSFSELANARAEAERLSRAGLEVHIVETPDGLHRVQAGPWERRGDAEAAVRQMGGFVVAC